MFNAATLNAVSVSQRFAQAATTDPRRVRVTTNAGCIMTAPIASVNVYPVGQYLFGLWDMRHGLIHDTHYNKAVKFSTIAEVEII